MFNRKPQTVLNERKDIQRNHRNEKTAINGYTPDIQPKNGFANINGFIMPF